MLIKYLILKFSLRLQEFFSIFIFISRWLNLLFEDTVLKWSTHRAIVDVVCRALGVSQWYSFILRSAVVEPDKRRGRSVHHRANPKKLLRLALLARNKVIEACLSFENKMALYEALKVTGYYLHYLHDQLIPSPKIIGEVAHEDLEREVSNVLRRTSLSLDIKKVGKLGKRKLAEMLQSVKAYEEPETIAKLALEYTAYSLLAIFGDITAPSDLDAKVSLFWQKYKRKLTVIIPLTFIISLIAIVSSYILSSLLMMLIALGIFYLILFGYIWGSLLTLLSPKRIGKVLAKMPGIQIASLITALHAFLAFLTPIALLCLSSSITVLIINYIKRKYRECIEESDWWIYSVDNIKPKVKNPLTLLQQET